MYKIESFTFQNGSTVNPGNLVLFIGPNNGGKSQALKDILSIITAESKNQKSVRSVKVQFPQGYLHIIDQLTGKAKRDTNGHLILDTVYPDMTTQSQLRVNSRNIEAGQDDLHILQDRLHTYLGRMLVSYLGTEARLALIKKQVNKSAHIEGHATLMEAAFNSDAAIIDDINNRVFSAFDTKLVLDRSVFATAQFRLGDPAHYHSGHAEYVERVRSLEVLDDQGDGIRAFSGIVIALETLKRPVVLIDEPETFLHPPQAFLIGRALAELRGANRQVFVSTHSADVLRGVLSVTDDVTIVRLSKTSNGFESRKVDPTEIGAIATDPVLSSARVLDGLFYAGVIITESDGDIVFYRKAIEADDPAASIHFVNSYSKQFSGKIIVPYKALAVPHAVIVDFDILRIKAEFRRLFEEMGGHWALIGNDYDEMVKEIEGENSAAQRLAETKGLLRDVQANLPNIVDDQEALVWLRGRLKEVRDAAVVWGSLKRRGRAGLSESGRNCFDRIEGAAQAVGLFIVPCGEREAWLQPHVAYTTNKGKWTEEALNYLSQNSAILSLTNLIPPVVVSRSSDCFSHHG